MPRTVGLDKDIYGTTFKWRPRLGYWCSIGERRQVLVVPPGGKFDGWKVVVPSMDRKFSILGVDDEMRAFVTAIAFAQMEE